jgi:hypothetical protein
LNEAFEKSHEFRECVDFLFRENSFVDGAKVSENNLIVRAENVDLDFDGALKGGSLFEGVVTVVTLLDDQGFGHVDELADGLDPEFDS